MWKVASAAETAPRSHQDGAPATAPGTQAGSLGGRRVGGRLEDLLREPGCNLRPTPEPAIPAGGRPTSSRTVRAVYRLPLPAQASGHSAGDPVPPLPAGFDWRPVYGWITTALAPGRMEGDPYAESAFAHAARAIDCRILTAHRHLRPDAPESEGRNAESAFQALCCMRIEGESEKPLAHGKKTALAQTVTAIEELIHEKGFELALRANDFATLSPAAAPHGGRAAMADLRQLCRWLWSEVQLAFNAMKRAHGSTDGAAERTAMARFIYFRRLLEQHANRGDPWTASREIMRNTIAGGLTILARQQEADHIRVLHAMVARPSPRTGEPVRRDAPLPTPAALQTHQAESAGASPDGQRGRDNLASALLNVPPCPVAFDWNKTYRALQALLEQGRTRSDALAERALSATVDAIYAIDANVIFRYRRHVSKTPDSGVIETEAAYNALASLHDDLGQDNTEPRRKRMVAQCLRRIHQLTREHCSIVDYRLIQAAGMDPCVELRSRQNEASSPSAIAPPGPASRD